MITGKQFRQILDKFIESPAGQHARVMDISEISLLENTLLGSKETHRLVFKCEKSRHPMGKIIGKL